MRVRDRGGVLVWHMWLRLAFVRGGHDRKGRNWLRGRVLAGALRVHPSRRTRRRGGGQPSARGAECGLLYDRRDAVCQRGGGRLLAVVEGSVPGSLPFALSPLRVRSNLRSALAPEAHGHGRDSPPEPRHALRKRSRPTLLASMSALALTWTHTALWRTRGYSTTTYDSLHTSAVRTALPATAFSVQLAIGMMGFICPEPRLRVAHVTVSPLLPAWERFARKSNRSDLHKVNPILIHINC